MVKAIFFDIDGTLVSFKTHTIPQSTQDALRELKRKGIKLFIASGRPPFHLKMLIEQFRDLFDGYITLNGQYCYNKEGVVIHENHINKADLIALVEQLKDKDISCGFLELDYYYFNKITKAVKDLRELLGNTAPQATIDDVNRIYSHKTYQLNLFLPEETEQTITQYLPNCQSVRWCPIFTDLIPKDGGKPVGVKHILDYYNISLAESMAFGDGGNDKDMLQFVNIGVAMGNGRDETKAVADYVTSDVDDDGIVNALKHFKIL